MPKTTDRQRPQPQFAGFFQEVYGDRWPALLAALSQPTRKIALWNRHCRMERNLQVAFGDGAVSSDASDPTPMFEEATLPNSGVAYFRHTSPTDTRDLPQPPHDEQTIAAYYLLDLASAFVVDALRIEPFHKVLDLCASPGGKSVIIAQQLAPMAELTANEVNADRCRRLRRTIAEYVPCTANHPTVKVVQKDGTRWHQPEHFDRVLIDAPCSSERHLVGQIGGTQSWTVAETERLAALQVQLVLRGLECLKVGGLLVYSTCSISPKENDEVIAKVLQKSRVGVTVERHVMPNAEASPLGSSILLPDKPGNAGPIYCCVLQRYAQHRVEEDSSSDEEDEEDDQESS